MMEIIPAIDIMNGQCVRLTKGDYSTRKVYYNDPVKVAVEFEDNGIRRLHLVDLDGAKAGRVMNLEVLKNIASGTELKIDFGGGVQSDIEINKVFEAGAAMITAGSIAVRNRPLFEKWMKDFGGEKIILGADVNNGFIAVSGWQENTDIKIIRFIRDLEMLGVQYVICTDISRDGMMKGPAIGLYRELISEFPGLKFIASGGVSKPDDLDDLAIAGLWGVIIGKAIYEEKIKMKDLKIFID
jgi:phosphoribosylformimino-5-aminoimidazole carboxamide ribotide isomerase